MHYLLFYEVAEDCRAAGGVPHRTPGKGGWQASQRGELVLGGALAHPVDGAVVTHFEEWKETSTLGEIAIPSTALEKITHRSTDRAVALRYAA